MIAGDSHKIDIFSPLRVQTSDGYDLLYLDPANGALKTVLSSGRFELSGSASTSPNAFCTGAVSNLHGTGTYFGYDLSGPDVSGRVIARDLGDYTSPHILDAPIFDVIECDGQSWQTIADYTPAEVDFEETSGETSAAISAIFSPMVNILRKSGYDGLKVSDGSGVAAVATISQTGILAGDLHRFAPEYNYSISRMAALARSRFQACLGISSNPSIVLNVGYPGTSAQCFLPDGVSYTYTDDDGVDQTTTAEIRDTLTEYLWTMNIPRRDSIKTAMSSKWFSRQLNYEFLTWIQGPFDDYGNAYSFFEAYREQQDLLVIPDHDGTPRNIMWDQGSGTTSRAVQVNGMQAQVDFCQANASGKDWLVGPRWPHHMRDYIHHSSFGALEYAERTGQAMAYVQKYGDWQPLWVTEVTFSGATVTLTVNSPRQTVGDLIVDTTAINAATNHGFTLWNDATDSAIAITDVSISGNTITITAASTLSGEIEVGYAARGVSQPDGTVEIPQHVGCWGNVKKIGRDAPSIIPEIVQPTLDQWLCMHKKVYTV
jgi:hypothetical protein